MVNPYPVIQCIYVCMRMCTVCMKPGVVGCRYTQDVFEVKYWVLGFCGIWRHLCLLIYPFQQLIHVAVCGMRRM